MLVFHFCEKFNQKLVNVSYREEILKKIDDFRRLTNLKHSTKVQAFGEKIFVFTYNELTRVLIEKRVIDGFSVYFFRDIIERTKKHFWTTVDFPRIKSGYWLNEHPLPQNEIDEFIKNQSFKPIITNPKTCPPIETVSWFDEFNNFLDLHFEIYESDSWVSFALYDLEKDGMRGKDENTFRFLLADLIIHKSNFIVSKELKTGVWQAQKDDVTVFYSKINENRKDYYFLHTGANNVMQKERLEKILAELTQDEFVIPDTLEKMKRQALRAYPSWTLQKDELWNKIQRSKENSNFSLLSEQIEFLKKFQSPAYVNGQAGSGKSTMLYYLFSNAYYLKRINSVKGNIIFLTENSNLLQNTRTAIRDLLVNNPQFELNTIEDFRDFDLCFASFKDFLLSLLPEDYKENFPHNKYLDFGTFKNLYENSTIKTSVKENYPADKVWFAITTYLVGYDFEKNISGDNYEMEVPKKMQNFLGKNDLEKIEKDILPFYKSLLGINYWDKLKIIRFLQENVEIPKYSFILCDEAQDFCRVELRFILQLSEFAQYDLSSTLQVPIVFAGDPNQTVNPTGFREAVIKDLMYKELTEIANFKLKTVETIYNPHFNYRSSQAVVNLANVIQYYRKKQLKLDISHPQEAKRIESKDSAQNVFIQYETLKDNEELIEKLGYKSFIAPIDSPEEKMEYFQKYKLQTAKHGDFNTKEEIDFKTAIEAKGADYQEVVLFGFGEYFLSKFKNFDSVRDGDDFQLRYFFNKLYVSITRAQIELIIIDSKESEEFFWKKLCDVSVVQDERWEMLKNYTDLILFNADTVNVRKSTPETALENAKTDKERGIYDKNPNRLKMAANQFFRLGDYDEQNICRALAEEIEKKWGEAAKFYLNVKKQDVWDKVAVCYWKGRLFRDLKNIGLKSRSNEQYVRLAISSLMLGDNLQGSVIKDLYDNRDVLHICVEGITWRDELTERFISLSKQAIADEHKLFWIHVLETYSQTVPNKLLITIGQLHFELGNYEAAVKNWDSASFQEHQNYVISKINIFERKKDFEQKSIWLNELTAYRTDDTKEIQNEILSYYDKDIAVKNDWYFFGVYHAFLAQKPQEALAVGQILEKLFSSQPEFLIDFFENLLEKYKFEHQVADFLTERWAKYFYRKEDAEKDNLEKLNALYKVFAQKHGLVFRPFTAQEINDIPNAPENILKMPPEHFKHIVIENFRRFNHLELSNLGQFNLIVGDNNTGKTSVLEALLFTPDEQEFAKRLAFAHLERSASASIKKLPRNFWTDFVSNAGKENPMTWTLKENRRFWQYNFPFKGKELSADFWDKTFHFVNMVFPVNGKELDEHLQNLENKESIKNPLVPFGKGYRVGLDDIYLEKISPFRKLRQEFISNMQVFIPEIEEITGIDGGGIGIGEEHFDESFPLYQYGEGANKLFRILLQLTFQENKRIMIDEIDAGIHFSRFPKFWEVILKVAHKNNIQIFATTHNLECIQYFKEVLEDEAISSKDFDIEKVRQASRVITLRVAPDSAIKATTRTYEEFSYSIERGSMTFRGGEL